MSSCPTLRCRELARALADLFAGGISLGEDARHYMESVAGCEDPADLPAILLDGDHPEHDSLLELVYFPDMAARLELEPVLGRHRFHAEDLPSVAEKAIRIAPRTRLLTDRGPLEIDTSHSGVELFLRRIHPQRIPDPEIAQLVEEYLPHGRAMRCRVHLRSCREAFSAPARRLLADFIRDFADDPDFEDGLLHLLLLAPQISEESDPVTALLDRRFRLENALDRARQQERDLQRHAVETLMTQRASLLSIDREAVRTEMDWLDRILVGTYQVMPTPRSGPEIAFDRDDSEAGPSRLFDFFSSFDS